MGIKKDPFPSFGTKDWVSSVLATYGNSKDGRFGGRVGQKTAMPI
jgi:hypothetical protein